MLGRKNGNVRGNAKERKNLASGIMFKGMGNQKPVYGWGWKRKSKDEF